MLRFVKLIFLLPNIAVRELRSPNNVYLADSIVNESTHWATAF